MTADQIIEARKAKRLTQQEVAEKLKIPRSSYAIKEKTGDFTRIEMETLTSLLEILEYNSEKRGEKTPDEYQGKYIGVLEQLLNQDLKEVKSRIEAVEQKLDKLLSSYARAEARQIGSFSTLQFVVEEVASIGKDEKSRSKSVAEARKRLSERLREANPAGK